jgi:DnaJ-class molecular chaperone
MNERYNAHLKKVITTNEGENFCPKCDGLGLVPRSGKIMEKTGVVHLICNKCLGDGKIDWVEKVVGKKRRINKIMNGDFEIWQRSTQIEK